MHHNYESSIDDQDDEANQYEFQSNSSTVVEISDEHMETFHRTDYKEAVELILLHTDTPCITSVTGHDSHGRVLAASVDIGAREYLLKRITKLANGGVLNPTKITMSSYNAFLGNFTLAKGTQISSTDLGMILSTGCGQDNLPVYRQIKPVVLSFGDSIHNSWEPEKAEIGDCAYDYLRPQLICFLKELHLEPIDGGILRKLFPSVVEGMIHAYLYSNLAIINCYRFKENLPLLLQILIQEFKFQVVFRSVEHLDIVFAHTVFEDCPRYVLIFSDESRMALLSTILIAIPLLNSLTGTNRCKTISIQTTKNLLLEEKPSYVFGEVRMIKECIGGELSLRLENVENTLDKPEFFERPPIPHDANVLLHLPPYSNPDEAILPAGSIVSCVIFGTVH